MQRTTMTCVWSLVATSWVLGQVVSVNTQVRFQTIDGFGTATWENVPEETWFPPMYFDDLGASMVRIDMVPKFKAPYTGFNGTFGSPWFHGNPPLPGSANITQPVSENVRKYTNPTNYQTYVDPSGITRTIPIAVMGPDLEENYQRCFTYTAYAAPRAAGALAANGLARNDPDGVKIIGAFWSPPPWVKIPSGNVIGAPGFNGAPLAGADFPFIWFDSYAGGILDVSGQPRPEFDDSAFGGTGPTTALTQFTRALASYTLGYQRHHGIRFYALSMQNEPHLEVFYNSCLYRDTATYITALKALRAEFDAHPELADIKLMGPEDTIGSESTYLWYWDNGGFRQAKFLQFLRDIEADPIAAAALDFYCVHGYDVSGVTSAVTFPVVWNWVANGWGGAPNPSVPPNVDGYQDFNKKCWMTETSGEPYNWLAPSSGFPNQGAYSIALKLHQALTTGNVSAWLYWQTASTSLNDTGALTDRNQRANSTKFNAARHFFKFIRPNAVRVQASANSTTISASAFIHEANGTLTIVVINESPNAASTTVNLPTGLGIPTFDARVSSAASQWQPQTLVVTSNSTSISIPGYGIATLVGNIAVADATAPSLQSVSSRKGHQ